MTTGLNDLGKPDAVPMTEQEYAALLKKSPRNWVAANNLAWLYAGDGRLDEALKYARVASEAAPERPEVKDTLAAINRRKGG